jgi:hypothetical protein
MSSQQNKDISSLVDLNVYAQLASFAVMSLVTGMLTGMTKPDARIRQVSTGTEKHMSLVFLVMNKAAVIIMKQAMNNSNTFEMKKNSKKSELMIPAAAKQTMRAVFNEKNLNPVSFPVIPPAANSTANDITNITNA